MAPKSLFREEWCAVATEEEPRINGQIRAREVRLISADGEQLGIKHIREAMDYGERADLDLVEVAPNANPPVVRMMDYGKFKYQKEQARKATSTCGRSSSGLR
jgi:translation initiation factor IF-3